MSQRAQQYIGAPIRRKEDVRFLTGAGEYIDDIKLPGMLHAAVLRSPHAHAKVTGIDASQAMTMPGVWSVHTFADIAALAKPIPVRVFELPGMDRFLQHPLANDTVRYVGEPLAVVVAENRYLAEDALDAIEVEYQPLLAVIDVQHSLTDQVLVHEACGTNLAGHIEISFGDADAAFNDAEYTRKEVFKTHRHTANPLETRGLLASYDAETGDLTVWGPTKVPHFNRGILASQLEIEPEKIHFIEPDVGGGFGVRGEFYPEDFLIPFAAMQTGRPVKWIEDRMEHLVGSNHSREVLCEAEIAVNHDGTILGLRAVVYGDMGGYVRTHGSVVTALTAGMLTGPYRIPAYHASINCAMTNKMGTGTYRAPGMYEGCFIRERLLDMAADDLGFDPAEFRLKNLIQSSEMPYTVGVTRIDGKNPVYDSGDYPSAFNKAMEAIDYQGLSQHRDPDEDGRYHGVGISSYVEPTGFGPFEGARVVVLESGQIEVYLGITTMGQGHETVMAQICADSLGVPMDLINIFHGSTDYLPRSIGTFGSRATVMAGSAITLACGTLKGRVLDISAGFLDTDAVNLEVRGVDVFRAGELGTEPALGLAEVVRLAQAGGGYDGGPGLEATEYFEIEEWTYAYGTHAVHVAVDPATGKLEILKYVAVEDVGRCINPLTMHGQAVGGTAQGIGGTILEELTYGEDGQLLAGTLVDYLLPTSTDIPPIESIILEEVPSPLNPLGVKGAGEGAILATGGALANAVANALGVQITELPLSPNRIREWARAKGL